MSRSLIFLLLLIWLPGPVSSMAQTPGGPPPRTTRTTRSVSSSGQFVIYSENAARRSQVARRAETARTEWNRLLAGKEGWKHPIIIQDLIGAARPRGNPSAATTIYEGDGGALKVQINIYDAAVIEDYALETELFRALGLEQTYRTISLKAGKPFRLPPAWLVEGMTEEMRVQKHGAPDGASAALLRSEHPPKIEEFMRQKPWLMESTSLSLYRTQARALIQALAQLSEGDVGLAALLESPEENATTAILRAYPSLENDPSRLGKIWTLAIARVSTNKNFQLLSIGESERSLAAILDISAHTDPKKPESALVRGPTALPLLARSEGGRFLMRQKASELLNLEIRCHPLLRPIIEEYRNIAGLLANKPKKNVDKQIAETGKTRELLRKRGEQLDDYLNWFEVTKLNSPSGKFLEMKPPPAAPPRTDPITLYLDAVEQRGW